MKAILRPFALVCALAFTLVSCSTDADETFTAEPVAVEVAYDYNQIEVELGSLINQHRASLGLPALEVVNYASYKSYEHNTYMIAHQVVNHDMFEQRANDIMEVLGASRVNENIAYNYQSAQGAFQAWLRSDGHRANIEGNFTHFGISVTSDPATGKKYFTNLFVKMH